MSRIKRIYMFLFLLMLSFLFSIPASASSFRVVKTSPYESKKKRTIKNTVFMCRSDGSKSSLYASKRGKKYTLTSSSCSWEVLSNGTIVYYFERSGSRVRLVRFNIGSCRKENVAAFSVKSAYATAGDFYFKKNTLYFIVQENGAEGDFSKIDLKTRKYKKIKDNVTFFTPYGHHFLMADGTGAGYSYLGHYNTKNDKYKKIASIPGDWKVKGSRVYVLVSVGGFLMFGSGKPVSVKVIMHDLNSSKTITLVDTITMYEYPKFTSSSITYTGTDGIRKTITY